MKKLYKNILSSSCKFIFVTGFGVIGSAAYAGFNPYAVFNANSNNDTANTVNNNGASNNTNKNNQPVAVNTPATNAPSNNAASAAAQSSNSIYLQPKPLTKPGQLTAPATNPQSAVPANTGPKNNDVPNYKNFNLNQPPAFGTPPANAGSPTNNNLPATNPNPVPQFNPASPEASNTTGMVIASGDMITLLNSINHGVANIKGNVQQLTSWQNTRNKNEAAAGAALIPSTNSNLNDFLANQSGYNGLTSLPTLYSETLSNGGFQSGISQQNNRSANPFGNLSETALLALPATQSQINQLQTLNQSTTKNKNLKDDNANFITPTANLFAQAYYNSLVGSLPDNAKSLQLTYQSSMYDLISYALNQIAAQTKPINNTDSEMSLLQTAVSAPFLASPDGSGQTWFQQLSTASTPQILRSLAILSAIQNEMQYQEIQNTQTRNMVQAATLTQLTAIEQDLTRIAQSEQQMAQAQQETNSLLQQLLLQMKTNKANGGN